MATTQRTRYGFGKTVKMPYSEAVERTKAALKEQGFGVLTEADIQQAMKEKLGIDFRPYVILGACNPPLAYQALQAEIDIGLLLPCNVVVYEVEGGSVVEALDAEFALGLVGNPALTAVGREARERLQKALDSISG